MAYEETTPSGPTCAVFFSTKPLNVDAYASKDGELPAMVMPSTPLDAFDPGWSVVEQPIGGAGFTALAAGSVRSVYRLRVGVTVFRAVTTQSPFKIQDVVFRVWPAGTTIADPDASMTQEAKPAPLSTLGWAGTIRERRTLLNRPKSSGNR